MGFDILNISPQLQYAIDDLGFSNPTPVQIEAYPAVMSGKNVVGISQTGTGKTYAYMLPILQSLKFSTQIAPRILIVVPTRELVIQVVEQIEALAAYINIRVVGVYGGTNLSTQAQVVAQGCDILVGTPARIYDHAINGILKLKSVYKLVIDEVDVMLDLGFRFQLTNIFDLIPERRQNIMFSATMTEEVEEIILDYFLEPTKIQIAVTGTPLQNIEQSCYAVKNFYTKVNLLKHLIKDKQEFKKVLVFVSKKTNADLLYKTLEPSNGHEMGIIHSGKSQNNRIRAVQEFDEGTNRILVTTDVMARGLDLDKISHVINFDVPTYPENYMHRIGRTGRAEEKGKTIMFFNEKEEAMVRDIEKLMSYSIPEIDFPEEVEISEQKTHEEKPKIVGKNPHKYTPHQPGASFHEKKAKNKKENLGSAFKRKMEKKYKKPITKGDKGANRRKK